MKIKKAFTLAEVLIVFVIIGIIASIGINTVKPWEKALKYSYSRIYNALGIATYNYVTRRAAVHNFPDNPTDLCEGLAYYMNNVSKQCTSFMGDPKTAEPNFAVNTPNLILSNGVKLWIASNGASPFSTNVNLGSGYVDNVIYFLVYADLTGDRKPNSAHWRASNAADIVAFAITNQFVVVPLGYPIVDRRYFTVHVMQPLSGEDDGDDSETPTDPMTFYEAATYAYGRNLKLIGDPLSYQMELNKEIFGPSSPFVVANCDRYTGDAGNACVGPSGSQYYSSQPKFNSTYCGVNNCGAADGSATTYCEPICSIKVYDYH